MAPTQAAAGELPLWAAIAQQPYSETITIDASRPSSTTFAGLGATVWPGDETGFVVAGEADPNLRGAFARFKPGSPQGWAELTWAEASKFTSAGAAYAYVAAHPAEFGHGGTSVERAFEDARRNGLRTVLVFFNVPRAFRAGEALAAEMVPQYANFLAALYRYVVHARGLGPPAYVELANEPDAANSSSIGPAEYSRLVEGFAGALNGTWGMRASILGPGTYYISHALGYAQRMFADGTAALLGGWSAHSYDDNFPGPLSDSFVKYLHDFFTLVVRAQPKPVLITELATAVVTFGGRRFATPDSTDGSGAAVPASDQPAYAATVIDRLVRIAGWSTAGGTPELGALVWEAHDTAWMRKSWGLLARAADTHNVHVPSGRTPNYRPLAYSLRPLARALAARPAVVPPEYVRAAYDPKDARSVVAVGLLTPPGAEDLAAEPHHHRHGQHLRAGESQLVVPTVNANGRAASVRLCVDGLPAARAAAAGTAAPPRARAAGTACTHALSFELEPFSVHLTILTGALGGNVSARDRHAAGPVVARCRPGPCALEGEGMVLGGDEDDGASARRTPPPSPIASPPQHGAHAAAMLLAAALLLVAVAVASSVPLLGTVRRQRTLRRVSAARPRTATAAPPLR